MFNPFFASLTDDSIAERMLDLTEPEKLLMGRVYTAMDALANTDEVHATPSPSGIHGCRLKNWYTAKGEPKTNRIPPASYKKMETGRHIEGFWREILDHVGFDVETLPASEPFKNYKGGQGDGLLTIRNEDLADAMRFPVGTHGLLELKDLGVWSFFDFVANGATAKNMESYKHQVMAYLDKYQEEFDMKFAVLLGGQADNSASTFIWNKIKRKLGMPPPFWLEILVPDPVIAAKDQARAGEINYYVENFEDAPSALKDFDPERGEFPCGSDERPYCGWRDLCLKVRR